MNSENLAQNFVFVLDAILYTLDDNTPETWEAAIALTLFSWNNEIKNNSIPETYYKNKLKILEAKNPNFWKEIQSKDMSFLINDVLRKRKNFFFPDDKRLIKEGFVNIHGTISVIEDNKEKTLHVEPF